MRFRVPAWNVWNRRTVEAPDLANGLLLIATKQSLALIPPDGKVCPKPAIPG